MKKWYSSAEAIRATRATYRQVDYWLTHGYAPTANLGQVGTGYQRRMSLQVVFQLAVIKELSDLGIKPSHATPAGLQELFTTGQTRRGRVTITLDLATIRDRLCDLLEMEMAVADECNSVDPRRAPVHGW